MRVKDFMANLLLVGWTDRGRAAKKMRCFGATSLLPANNPLETYQSLNSGISIYREVADVKRKIAPQL